MEECIEPLSLSLLFVLPSGPDVDDPTELLTSGDLEGIRDQLFALGFDTILIHGPPVPASSDLLVLAHAVDATVLVIQPAGAERAAVQTALSHLRGLSPPLLGVVVNELGEAA